MYYVQCTCTYIIIYLQETFLKKTENDASCWCVAVDLGWIHEPHPHSLAG
jgi:hypothetical protein